MGYLSFARQWKSGSEIFLDPCVAVGALFLGGATLFRGLIFLPVSLFRVSPRGALLFVTLPLGVTLLKIGRGGNEEYRSGDWTHPRVWSLTSSVADTVEPWQILTPASAEGPEIPPFRLLLGDTSVPDTDGSLWAAHLAAASLRPTDVPLGG